MTMEIDTVAEPNVLSTDNIPTAQVLSKYRLAGHFCSVAIKSVLAKCLPGVNCTELCQIGDEGILSQTERVYQSNERGIAEPTSINVNNCVRRYAPLSDEEGYVLQEGDIVTVSLGVHIDGYAVVSSQTIHVQLTPAPATGAVADAVCALHFATQGIINLLPTSSTMQIEEVLNEALDTYGVKVVEGSCLRRIRRFLIGQPTVEERDGKILEFGDETDEWTTVPGEVYLLDLAISTGTGIVKVHPDLRPTIYTRSITAAKAHTNFKLTATRALYTQLTSSLSLYSVFPFTLRQNPSPARARLGLTELVTHRILQPCAPLVEKSPTAIVVRRTLTVFVRNQGEVVILGGGDAEAEVMWVRSEKGVRAGGVLEAAIKGDGVKVVQLKKDGEKMDLDE